MFCVGDNVTILVFEYLNHNRLLHKVIFEKSHTLHEIAIIAKKLGLILRNLRMIGMTHGDFRTHNLIISEDLQELKLIDFGRAYLYDADTFQQTTNTINFKDPESMLGLCSTTRSEFWSFGIILLVIYVQANIFVKDDKVSD